MAKMLSDGSIRLKDGRIIYPHTQVLASDLPELLPILYPQNSMFPGFFRGSSVGLGGGGGGSRGEQGVPGPIGLQGIPGPPGPINQVQNEGSNLPVKNTLNFIGNGVTAVDNPGAGSTDVTIPGGDELQLGSLIGGILTWDSVTSVSIGTTALVSQMRDEADSFDIDFTGVIGPVDITVSGANGLDSGAEAPSTWYAVHVIADSTAVNPVAGLLSTSADAPVLPAGYDKFRRVGWVRNGAASDFLTFYQRGAGLDRTYNYDVDRSLLAALLGGTAAVFTAVPLDAFIPPTSRFVIMNAGFDTANAGDIANLRPTGSSVSNPVVFVSTGSTPGANRITNLIEMVVPSDSVDYQIVNAGGGTPALDIYVQGFRDSLR